MTSEQMIRIDDSNFSVLRFARKAVREKTLDFGYTCLVGDKLIRIYPNNRVEIADIEYIRAEDVDGDEAGQHTVAYMERLSWTAQFPAGASRDQIKASVDFAFMSAGLPSIFYFTNLYLTSFSTFEAHIVASIKVFRIFYPELDPVFTDLNGVLMAYGRDLYELDRSDAPHDR